MYKSPVRTGTNAMKADDDPQSIDKTLTVTCENSFVCSLPNATFVSVKKLFAILLIMLYGVSSTGATVQLHYCCGKLKTIKLSAAPVKDCGNKQKMGSKPCCDTKEIKAKSQDQQDVYTFSVAPNAVELPTFFTEVNSGFAFHPLYFPQAAYSSPPLSKSLFVLNCVFRI
jgi:hypothetical protein